MTDHISQYKEHLRAMFKGESERSRQILESMGDGPWPGTGRFNLAVFGLATEMRFEDDESHEAVLAFVARLMDSLQGQPGAPKPLQVELLIRAALGETELLDEVPAETANTIMPLVAHVVVNDLELTGQAIDQLLDDAEEAARA